GPPRPRFPSLRRRFSRRRAAAPMAESPRSRQKREPRTILRRSAPKWGTVPPRPLRRDGYGASDGGLERNHRRGLGAAQRAHAAERRSRAARRDRGGHRGPRRRTPPRRREARRRLGRESVAEEGRAAVVPHPAESRDRSGLHEV